MSGGDRGSPRGLQRLGSWCARRPRRAIALWLLALVLAVGTAGLAGGTFSDKVELSGTQAAAGLQLLEEHDKAAGGFAGQVVFHVAVGQPAARAVRRSKRPSPNCSKLHHVESASDPLASGSGSSPSDGRIAYSTVHFDERTKLLGHALHQEARSRHRAARQGRRRGRVRRRPGRTVPAPGERRALGGDRHHRRSAGAADRLRERRRRGHPSRSPRWSPSPSALGLLGSRPLS